MLPNRDHIWKYINIKQDFMVAKIHNSSLLALLEITSLGSQMWDYIGEIVRFCIFT